MITLINLTKEMRDQFIGIPKGLIKEKDFINTVKSLKSRANSISKLGNNDYAIKIKEYTENIINYSEEFHKKTISAQRYKEIVESQIKLIIDAESQYKDQIVKALTLI